MKKTALTLASLTATFALSSCSADETRNTPVDTHHAPSSGSADTQVLSDMTSGLVADQVAKVDPEAQWHWLIDPSGIMVADGAVTVPLHDQGRDAAVKVCNATRKAVRATGFKPMAVTVQSIETSLPLAQASPESKFDKRCLD